MRADGEGEGRDCRYTGQQSYLDHVQRAQKFDDRYVHIRVRTHLKGRDPLTVHRLVLARREPAFRQPGPHRRLVSRLRLPALRGLRHTLVHSLDPSRGGLGPTSPLSSMSPISAYSTDLGSVIMGRRGLLWQVDLGHRLQKDCAKIEN